MELLDLSSWSRKSRWSLQCDLKYARQTSMEMSASYLVMCPFLLVHEYLTEWGINETCKISRNNEASSLSFTHSSRRELKARTRNKNSRQRSFVFRSEKRATSAGLTTNQLSWTCSSACFLCRSLCPTELFWLWRHVIAQNQNYDYWFIAKGVGQFSEWNEKCKDQVFMLTAYRNYYQIVIWNNHWSAVGVWSVIKDHVGHHDLQSTWALRDPHSWLTLSVNGDVESKQVFTAFLSKWLMNYNFWILSR